MDTGGNELASARGRYTSDGKNDLIEQAQTTIRLKNKIQPDLAGQANFSARSHGDNYIPPQESFASDVHVEINKVDSQQGNDMIVVVQNQEIDQEDSNWRNSAECTPKVASLADPRTADGNTLTRVAGGFIPDDDHTESQQNLLAKNYESIESDVAKTLN